MEQRTAEQRRDYNVLLNLRDRLAEAEADRAPKWYTARLRRDVEEQEAKLEGLLVTDQPSPSSEEGVFEVWA